MKKTMPEGAPELIAINHDDYHAKYVGTINDGRQFFLTTPFVPLEREFVALYLFNAQGDLLEAKIDDFGTREQMDKEKRRQLMDSRLAELGDCTFEDIEIAPFSIERFGIEFGLIPQIPEEEDEDEEICWVTVEPGDYMAFYPPWDGNYDT